MRLSDEGFSNLSRLAEFEDDYQSLSVAETMDEIDRLYTDGPTTRTLFQNLALQKRLTEAACFDAALTEQQRTAVIGVVTGMRETIESIMLPVVAADMQERVKAALAGSNDYVDRFGTYPRAALMISVGARKPSGPYEMSVMGQVLAKS